MYQEFLDKKIEEMSSLGFIVEDVALSDNNQVYIVVSIDERSQDLVDDGLLFNNIESLEDISEEGIGYLLAHGQCTRTVCWRFGPLGYCSNKPVPCPKNEG